MHTDMESLHFIRSSEQILIRLYKLWPDISGLRSGETAQNRCSRRKSTVLQHSGKLRSKICSHEE